MRDCAYWAYPWFKGERGRYSHTFWNHHLSRCPHLLHDHNEWLIWSKISPCSQIIVNSCKKALKAGKAQVQLPGALHFSLDKWNGECEISLYVVWVQMSAWARVVKPTFQLEVDKVNHHKKMALETWCFKCGLFIGDNYDKTKAMWLTGWCLKFHIPKLLW